MRLITGLGSVAFGGARYALAPATFPRHHPWSEEGVEVVELHPANPSFGVDANSDMPSDVLDLYNEAQAVAPISPRSAAALLRVALETLLQGPAFNLTGKLHKMIGELQNRADLQDFWQEVDVVRVVGNEAAHEATFRPTDGESVVHELQAIVNELVQVEITRPRLRTERINRIPANKRRT